MSLYILAEFKEKLMKLADESTSQFVEKLVTELLWAPQTDTSLKMRILWFLERLATSERFFQNKE